ncbi:hypothetical protein AB0L54_32650 [Streptomyces sp. NPDC052196]|uniref:hypothetical protein n=1 Tax=Streptomyces sp. NPDC052196 TaxID=3156691 RepID=UPI003436A633
MAATPMHSREGLAVFGIFQNVRIAAAVTVLVPLLFVCLTLFVLGLAILVTPKSRHSSTFRAMGILRQVIETLMSGYQTKNIAA